MKITLSERDVNRMDETPSGIPYDYSLTVRGAYFTMFKIPGKTLEDVKEAKAWLRGNRDVIKIEVVKVEKIGE